MVEEGEESRGRKRMATGKRRMHTHAKRPHERLILIVDALISRSLKVSY